MTLAFMPQAIRTLLRRRRVARHGHRLLGRGAAARHGRLGAGSPSDAPRRDVPRHLRRRALRRRPRPRSSRRTGRRAPRSRSASSRSTTRSSSGSSSPTRTGRVERFLEKPSWGQVFSDTINTGHLRARAGGARATSRTDRPYDFSKELFPLLLEMGRPLYGHVLRRLLAGHRQPRPVPAGELRRARRARAARRARHPAARQRLGRRGRRHRRRRGRRGAGVHRQQLPDRRRRLDRPVLGALAGRDRPRAAHGSTRSVVDAAHVRRPERASSRARSSAAAATSATTCASTRAWRSATR